MHGTNRTDSLKNPSNFRCPQKIHLVKKKNEEYHGAQVEKGFSVIRTFWKIDFTMTTVANISSSLTAQAPVVSAAATSVAASPAAPSYTPPSRILADPLSGVVIAQVLNASGAIVSQVPARSVIAYLQEGLTSDGFPKQSTTA